MNIKLTIKNYRCFSDENPLHITVRDGFTAYVGVNNAGKSTILKFLYELRGLFESLIEQQNLTDIFRGRGRYLSFNYPPSVFDRDDIYNNDNSRDLSIEMVWEKPLACRSITKVIFNISRDSPNRCYPEWYVDGKRYTPTAPVRDIPLSNDINMVNIPEGEPINVAGLRESASILQNTLYLGPFRNIATVGTKDDYFDISVGQSFILKWREFKSGRKKQDHYASIEITEAIKRIFQYQSLEINVSGNGDEIQIVADGKSYWLNELGAGIAQFIIVLASAAMKKPSIILIDEPELSLHPSLQIDFLTTLGSYATNGVIFATHNLGLARATADSIYSVQRVETGSIVKQFEETPTLSEFLGELSFSGYRDIGYDKILLIEGSTEMKTMQQFLRLYGKDHIVVLLPLGGGQLIKANAESELNELKRLSENIYALVDSEKKSKSASLDKDRIGFKKTCKKLGITCHILERRAIENYFTDDAVKRAFGNQFQSLKPFDLLKDAKLGWAKSQNWKVAREMTKEDVDKTDLGKFLESI